MHNCKGSIWIIFFRFLLCLWACGCSDDAGMPAPPAGADRVTACVRLSVRVVGRLPGRRYGRMRRWRRRSLLLPFSWCRSTGVERRIGMMCSTKWCMARPVARRTCIRRAYRPLPERRRSMWGPICCPVRCMPSAGRQKARIVYRRRGGV